MTKWDPSVLRRSGELTLRTSQMKGLLTAVCKLSSIREDDTCDSPFVSGGFRFATKVRKSAKFSDASEPLHTHKLPHC